MCCRKGSFRISDYFGFKGVGGQCDPTITELKVKEWQPVKEENLCIAFRQPVCYSFGALPIPNCCRDWTILGVFPHYTTVSPKGLAHPIVSHKVRQQCKSSLSIGGELAYVGHGYPFFMCKNQT